MKHFITMLMVFIVSSMFYCALTSSVLAGQNDSNYLEKAKLGAEKARAEAEKAMAEAELAISQAEKAISDAENIKAKAKKDKVEALEKMVQEGHIPEDIAMKSPENSTVAVFSHNKHTQREKLRCIECHPKVFIMKVGKSVVKKGHLTMAEMKKGKYCGNCHDGSKAFSVTSIEHCKRCHPKK